MWLSKNDVLVIFPKLKAASPPQTNQSKYSIIAEYSKCVEYVVFVANTNITYLIFEYYSKFFNIRTPLVLIQTCHVLATIAQQRFSLFCVNCFQISTFPRLPHTNESQDKEGVHTDQMGVQQNWTPLFHSCSRSPVVGQLPAGSAHVRSDRQMSGIHTHSSEKLWWPSSSTEEKPPPAQCTLHSCRQGVAQSTLNSWRVSEKAHCSKGRLR